MTEKVHALLEHSTGYTQIIKMETELEAARAEQQRYPQESYVYGAIGRDIAQKEEELARFRQEMGSVGSIEHALAIYQERLLWFLSFLTEMHGKYEVASFQEKRNALDVLGVRVTVHEAAGGKPDIDEQAWYTIKEAARLWGVNTETVDAYIRSGRLTVRKESERKRWVNGANLLALIREGYGYHNDDKGVQTRITIEYEPEFRGGSTIWEPLQTKATGVANYRLS